jgi:hypothetical protein
MKNKDTFNEPVKAEHGYLFEDGEHVFKEEPLNNEDKVLILTIFSVMTACVAVLYAFFTENYEFVKDFAGLFVAYWFFLIVHKIFNLIKRNPLFYVGLVYLVLFVLSTLSMGMAILFQVERIAFLLK